MNIHQFQPGDIITRTKLARNKYGEISDEELAGISMLGDRLTLREIEHGCIYLESPKGDIQLLETDIMDFDWSEGWEYYKELESAKKTGKNWFYAGLVIYVVLLMSFCVVLSNIQFYSLLSIGCAGLLCFGIYLTKMDHE